MMYIHKHKTLYEAFFHHRTVLLDIFMVLFSVVLMTLAANIQIPLWPVPITLQTFGVFAIAFWFGSQRGTLTMLAYIAAGIVGFGVFASFKSGPDVFFSIKEGVVALGPSAGYILGFVAAAYVVGLLIEKGYGRTFGSVLLVVLIGEVLIYAFGLPWLWLALPQLGLVGTLNAGLFPFIIGDTLKALAAVALFPHLWKGAEKLNKSP